MSIISLSIYPTCVLKIKLHKLEKSYCILDKSYIDIPEYEWELKKLILKYEFVVSESGIAEPVYPKAFSELFALCSWHVQCVLLNACFTMVQAESISKHIDYVIGAPGRISDRAVIKFSTGFYAGLGAGKSYEEAFKTGRIRILQAFPDTPEHLIPIMKNKESSVNQNA